MFAQFAQPAPAPTSLAANVSSPTSPTTTPTRSGRLRGLSYLRSYTSTHLHPLPPSPGSSRSPEPSLTPTGSGRPASPERPSRRRRHSSNTKVDQGWRSSSEPNPTVPETSPQSSEQSSTSGWLPTVGGRSGLSRIPSRPQPTSTAVCPAVELASSRTSAAQTSSDLVTSMTRARPGGAPAGVRPPYNSPTMSRDFSTLNGHDHRVGAINAASDRQGRSTSQEQRGPSRLAASPDTLPTNAQSQMPSIRFVPHHDPRASRPSLNFNAVSRILPSGTSVIRVGRYSEKDNDPNVPPGAPSAAPVGFKSKVVSRRHCELWCSSGQWYIKDVKSSSGTFLNHIRLSQPNLESKPFPLNDGDVVQLGIDFKGGEEMIFRCVKIRVECNRGWQKALNSFNTTTHRQLRDLAAKNAENKDALHSSECSICLLSIAPCQPLFVAPCSHVWHYKCVRPILNGPTWPTFLCPNCRAVADLEAEVDEPVENWEDDVEEDSKASHSRDSPSIPPPSDGDHSQPSLDPNATINIGNDDELAAILGAISVANDDLPVNNLDSGQRERPAEGSTVESRKTSRSSIASRKLDSVKALDLASRPPISNPTSSLKASDNETVNGNRCLHDRVREPRRSSSGSSRVMERPSDTVGTEGPLTPRNDAGPFVFDGSAGRSSEGDASSNLNGGEAEIAEEARTRS